MKVDSSFYTTIISCLSSQSPVAERERIICCSFHSVDMVTQLSQTVARPGLIGCLTLCSHAQQGQNTEPEMWNPVGVMTVNCAPWPWLVYVIFEYPFPQMQLAVAIQKVENSLFLRSSKESRCQLRHKVTGKDLQSTGQEILNYNEYEGLVWLSRKICSTVGNFQ